METGSTGSTASLRALVVAALLTPYSFSRSEALRGRDQALLTDFLAEGQECSSSCLVDLRPIEDDWVDKNKLFLIESSGLIEDLLRSPSPRVKLDSDPRPSLTRNETKRDKGKSNIRESQFVVARSAHAAANCRFGQTLPHMLYVRDNTLTKL